MHPPVETPLVIATKILINMILVKKSVGTWKVGSRRILNEGRGRKGGGRSNINLPTGAILRLQFCRTEWKVLHYYNNYYNYHYTRI